MCARLSLVSMLLCATVPLIAFCTVLTIVCASQADLLMGVFDGGPLEAKAMSRVGCLDYAATPWQDARPGVLERHASYKFNRYMSIFGGEVVSTQLRLPSDDGDGWTVYDVITLRNVPFGDFFRVRTQQITTTNHTYELSRTYYSLRLKKKKEVKP